MKKCINCGREIPDDAVFCGFCGTRQPEAENKEEEKETAEKLNPETSQETKDADTTGSETAEEVKENASVSTTEADDPDNENESSPDSEVENTAETPETEEAEDSDIRDAEIVESPEEEKNSDESESSEDHTDPDQREKEGDSQSGSDEPAGSDDPEEQPSDGNDSRIKDAEIVENSEPDQPEKSDEKTEVKDAETEKQTNENTSDDQKEASSEKKKKPHIQMKKIDLPKINVSRKDFDVLLDLIQNPVEKHGIDNTTTWIILIFAWIANWIAFRSFSAGFFSLLIVLIGMIILNWLTLKDHVTFGETVRNSAEVIFVPSLLVFAGGLFIRNVRAGAEVFAFHSIFSTAFIGLFFLTAALILFLLIVIKKYEMKIWQIVLILTIISSLLIWYLMTSGAIALFS